MTAQSTVLPTPGLPALPTNPGARSGFGAANQPVTVTIQVTLPGGEDTMQEAAKLAEQLHALTAVATVDSQPSADVSTTVAVVVEHTGPRERGSSHLFVRPLNDNYPYEPIDPASVRLASPSSVARSTQLRIDNSRRDVVLGGVPVLLTRREYDLLLFLAGHPGRVFTRPQLLKWVWGYDIVSGERTVDVHIRRLRRKLRQQGPTITTIRGIGYRLDDYGAIDVVD